MTKKISFFTIHLNGSLNSTVYQNKYIQEIPNSKLTQKYTCFLWRNQWQTMEDIEDNSDQNVKKMAWCLQKRIPDWLNDEYTTRF